MKVENSRKMMKEYIYNKVSVIAKRTILLLLAPCALLIAGCNDYLDKLPDNRMELKTKSDIADLLVSAYPQTHPAYLLEMYSDNTDECIGPEWSEADRFQRQAYHWEDITEIGNDESPQQLWNTHYQAVASANAGMQFVEGQPDATKFNENLAEALLCRAYAMFQLSTVFCNAYNPATASTEPGLPYPKKMENVIGQQYERGTLEELYDNIRNDIEKALPLVGNSYQKPKFHFNPDAANAFACRFFLYKGDFDKAIAYATKVLGSNPTSKARNWAYYRSLNANKMIRPEAYVNSGEKTNFMLQAVFSEWGAVIYGGYQYGDRYAHSYRIAYDESICSSGPWGSAASAFQTSAWSNDACADVHHCKIPYEFEYTDLQARIGHAHAEFSVFNTELLLIERAEAYALKGDLESAMKDYNTLLSVYMRSPRTYTKNQIVDYYKALNYYAPLAPTVKKQFDAPVYQIDEDGSDQESVLQAIMHLRRILTAHEGFRMQDVKRYGITIYRRQTNVDKTLTGVTDVLTANDPRRAIQLPQDVITAGLEGNKRSADADLGEPVYQNINVEN